MTATLTRASQAMAEWTKVFPRQITETYTSSVTFIKQLTVVAVSTITYLKNAFPEDNYTVDQFGGLKIRVLKNKCTHDLAQFLITALTQAFDAFDKKYLHQIALCFYEETCAADNLLEYHVFEYAYNAEGATLRVRSGGRGGNAEAAGGSEAAAYSLEAIRDRTLQLIRACMVMLSQTSLPETYDVSLRLYYNEAAPVSYQAPGFCAARTEEEDALLETSDSRIKLGGVRTPFHAIHMHTYLREMRAHAHASCEPQVSQMSASYRDELDSEASTEAGAVRCECGRADRPAYTALLVCRHCGYRQHAACYGLRRSGGGDVPSATHCCVPCAERTGSETDQGLVEASNRQCYAIFRRALWWMSAGRGEGAHALSGAELAAAVALGPTSTRKLQRVLRVHALLANDPPTDETTPIDVVTDKLESVLERHFVTETPEEDVAARLVEESLSQRSDLLGEVLSPLERVSLQAASRVDIESVASKTTAEDPAMNEYRSVMTDSEEPLPPPMKEPRKRRAERPRTGVKTKKVRASRD